MSQPGICAVVGLAAASMMLPAIGHAADFNLSGDSNSGVFGDFFNGNGRRVTVYFKKTDLTTRSKLQKAFIQRLIWRRYGRRTQYGKALVAKVDAHYRGLIRDKFIAQIRKKHPEVWPFGFFVDRMVTRIAKILEKSQSDGVHSFTVTIPKKWFVKRGEMNLVLEVVKGRIPRLDVYMIKADGGREKVFTSLAAPGNFYRSFASPNGIMYTSRFIDSPRWYPCATKWATEPCRQPRGMNTAFGLGGIDLTRRDYLAGYGPRYGSGTVSPYLIHSTNMYGTPGHYASHGCVRIYPHKADELFDALKHYYAMPDSGKLRDFGVIWPFVKTIPVLLGSPAQLVQLRRQLQRRQSRQNQSRAQD